ncbi:MAG TPA: DNA polymerase III subunit beta [Chloroflexota bacterium]|nr:DNA polymerase III subunit beta [Chloroflexota bacterium]
MKLECLQEHLAEGLTVVGRVVPSKSTLPVLSNVLLSTRDGELQLTANNLELSVAHRVPAAVAREGEITLPARLLSDYVNLLGHGQKVELDLNSKTHKVHLACGRYEANVAGIDAEDFPPVPAVSGGQSFSIPANVLKEAIDDVVFAAAPDDTRPVLAGVQLKIGNGTLTLAAADGFRLAVRIVDLPQASQDLSMIVPAKTLSEVARILPDSADEEVQINITPNGNQIYFAFGKTEVTSRLIEGQFPDYQRIIPPDAKTKVKVSTTDFLRATRAATVFARDNSNIVRLECSPPKSDAELAIGSVLVKSTSAEMGDNEGTLDTTGFEGDETQIAFNGRYLRDALEAIDTPDVLLQITGPSSPGIIKPASDSNGYIHVIMPMHVAR